MLPDNFDFAQLPDFSPSGSISLKEIGVLESKIEDIDYKRPGGNIDPEMTEFIVGRTVNKNLENDHVLTKEDII